MTGMVLGNGIPGITDREFHLIADLVYDRAGIRLTPQKKALVEGRLGKLIRKLGLPDFRAYHDFVVNDATGQATTLLLDLITTNHSFFYREKDHFEYLKRVVLPELSGRNRLRIWCAGCAGGEESWTLAMVIADYFGPDLAGRDIGILATDISLSALAQAQQGSYPADKTRALPAEYRTRFLQTGSGGEVRVQDSLRELVLYKHLNLTDGSFPFSGVFDIVFCRNVMIYFDAASRARVVDRFAAYMEPGAWLFIGHSESLGRDSVSFRYLHPATYRRI